MNAHLCCRQPDPNYRCYVAHWQILDVTQRHSDALEFVESIKRGTNNTGSVRGDHNVARAGLVRRSGSLAGSMGRSRRLRIVPIASQQAICRSQGRARSPSRSWSILVTGLRKVVWTTSSASARFHNNRCATFETASTFALNRSSKCNSTCSWVSTSTPPIQSACTGLVLRSLQPAPVGH